MLPSFTCGDDLLTGSTSSPSGGLVDNPQDTTFYDWLLKDPKDSPFAQFRFHYRSWTNLKQLNLVPCIETKDQPPPPPHGLGSLPTTEAAVLSDLHIIPFAFGLNGLDGSIFEDHTFASSGASVSQSGGRKYELKAPPERVPMSVLKQRGPRRRLPRSVAPESRQNATIPPTGNHAVCSRKSSIESHAPSVAPSLMRYVEDEISSNDGVEYGVATRVSLPERPLPFPPIQDSPSDYANSPPSSENSRSSRERMPQTYQATTGQSLEKQLACFSSSSNALDTEPGLPMMGTLSLTESEWMKKV